MALSTFAHMERLISLRDAAQKFGLSEERLRELIQEGSIRAVMLPGGEIGLSEDLTLIVALNSKLEGISRSQFAHLNNNWITIADTSAKYDVPNRTIRTWIRRGYIQVNEACYPSTINEGDIAYCIAIYLERRKMGLTAGGAPLLDESGRPYTLKHPKLSKYRQRKKQSPKDL